MIKKLLVLVFLIYPICGYGAEDVVVLFRGVHGRISPGRKPGESDILSPQLHNKSAVHAKQLCDKLRSLRSRPDTLAAPVSLSLLHGLTQRFVNDYYRFCNDLLNPESKLYGALDAVDVHAGKHFFISTSLSLETAARFAAGCLLGNSKDRVWPDSKGVTSIGWIEAFVIPSRLLESLGAIVVSEGHALGSLNVIKPEFLRASEVIFPAYIPKEFHQGRLLLKVGPVPHSFVVSQGWIVAEVMKQVNPWHERIGKLMGDKGYSRVFGSSWFVRALGIKDLLTDKNSQEIRGGVLSTYEVLAELPRNADGSVLVNIDDLWEGADLLNAHAIAFFARQGNSVRVSVMGEDFSPLAVGLQWIIPLIQESNVKAIEWDTEEGSYLQDIEDEEERLEALKELGGSGHRWEEVPRDEFINLRAAIRKRKAPMTLRLDNMPYNPDFLDDLAAQAKKDVVVEDDNRRDYIEEEEAMIDEYYQSRGYISWKYGSILRLIPGDDVNPDMIAWATGKEKYGLIEAGKFGFTKARVDRIKSCMSESVLEELSQEEVTILEWLPQ